MLVTRGYFSEGWWSNHHPVPCKASSSGRAKMPGPPAACRCRWPAVAVVMGELFQEKWWEFWLKVSGSLCDPIWKLNMLMKLRKVLHVEMMDSDHVHDRIELFIAIVLYWFWLYLPILLFCSSEGSVWIYGCFNRRDGFETIGKTPGKSRTKGGTSRNIVNSGGTSWCFQGPWSEVHQDTGLGSWLEAGWSGWRRLEPLRHRETSDMGLNHLLEIHSTYMAIWLVVWNIRWLLVLHILGRIIPIH